MATLRDVPRGAGVTEQFALRAQARQSAGEGPDQAAVAMAGATDHAAEGGPAEGRLVEGRPAQGGPLLRHEVERRAPDDLGGGVSQHRLGAVRDVGDDPLGVGLPDVLGGRFLHPALAILALPATEFVPPPLPERSEQVREESERLQILGPAGGREAVAADEKPDQLLLEANRQDVQ